MAITINGSGTITGISAGGLPDGSVTAADIESSLDLSAKTLTLPAGTGGKVLQVVQTTYASTSTTTSTSYVDTGHSATITPSSTTSKILVMAVYSLGNYSDTCATWSKVNRGATELIVQGAYANGNQYGIMPTSIVYLDSPSTTSATTYKTQFRTDNGSASASYGHPVVKTYGAGTAQFTSTITLMEIAA